MKRVGTILFSVLVSSILFSQGLTYEPSKPKIKPYSPDSLLKESNHHLGMGIILTATGPEELITGCVLVILRANAPLTKLENNLFYPIGGILIIAGTISMIAGPIAIFSGQKEGKLSKERLLPKAYINIPSPLINYTMANNGTFGFGLSTAIRF